MGCGTSKPEPDWVATVDSGTVILKFQDLNRRILEFSEKLFRPLPPYTNELAHSPLFRFLATLNKRLQSAIYDPFHPCLSAVENERYNTTYAARFSTGRRTEAPSECRHLLPYCILRAAL